MVQVCVGISDLDITDEHLEDLSWKRDCVECYTVILCRTRRGTIGKVPIFPVIFNTLGYYQSNHSFQLFQYTVLVKISLIDQHSCPYLT